MAVVLSVDFYGQVSQIIPVLLLTGLVEMAAVSRRWASPTLPMRMVVAILIGMAMMVFGEVAALWAVSNDAENGWVRSGALFGLGAAGSFAMMPLVDTVLDWAGEANRRPKWLEFIGIGVAMLPFWAAAIAAVAAGYYD